MNLQARPCEQRRVLVWFFTASCERAYAVAYQVFRKFVTRSLHYHIVSKSLFSIDVRSLEAIDLLKRLEIKVQCSRRAREAEIWAPDLDAGRGLVFSESQSVAFDVAVVLGWFKKWIVIEEPPRRYALRNSPVLGHTRLLLSSLCQWQALHLVGFLYDCVWWFYELHFLR